MINCDFLIFNNCNYFIKDSILLFSRWFCSLEPIRALKKKWTIISIESSIGVRYIKPVYIIGWWNYTYSFMNGKIIIMKYITYIQNPVSKSMHSRDSNVDYG